MPDQSITQTSLFDLPDAIEWRPVPGHEDQYEVSSTGIFRRSCNGYNQPKGKIISPRVGKHGYVQIGLSRGGKQITHRAHKLVAVAFLGLCPDGQVVNHKDGIKTNNRIENLEYRTLSGNHQHALEMGLLKPPKGEKHWQGKLTSDAVRDIRETMRSAPVRKHHAPIGQPMWMDFVRALAAKYNVSATSVFDVLAGRTWKHVT